MSLSKFFLSKGRSLLYAELLQHNYNGQTRKTPVPCHPHPAPCSSCRRYVLCRWFHRRPYFVGLRYCLVHCSYHHDSHLRRISIQHGMVGLYLSSQSVPFAPLHLKNTARLIECWTGVFTLLTITIGEELESRFFKVTSCVSSLSSTDHLERPVC